MLPIFAPAPTWPFPMLDIHPTLDQQQYFSATDGPWSTGSVWPRENSSLECMRSGGRVHLSAEDLLEDLLRMHEGTRREIYCEGKSQSSQLHLAHLLPCWRAGKSSLQVAPPAAQSRDKQAWWSRSAHKPSTLLELQLVVGCNLVYTLCNWASGKGEDVLPCSARSLVGVYLSLPREAYLLIHPTIFIVQSTK